MRSQLVLEAGGRSSTVEQNILSLNATYNLLNACLYLSRILCLSIFHDSDMRNAATFCQPQLLGARSLNTADLVLYIRDELNIELQVSRIARVHRKRRLGADFDGCVRTWADEHVKDVAKLCLLCCEPWSRSVPDPSNCGAVVVAGLFVAVHSMTLIDRTQGKQARGSQEA